MLNNKEKKHLKSLANTIDNKYLVGKEGVSDELITMLSKALDAKELIKVQVQQSVAGNLKEYALDLASELNATIVQEIGHVIVLYRQNRKKPIIKF